MSPRRFAGWEPEVHTEHRYDDTGRLVESIQVTEPEWSEEDRAWAQALIELEWVECPGCGGDLTLTTESDPDAGWLVDHKLCKKCKALTTARDAYHERQKDDHGHSDVHEHMWTAKPIRRT